MSLCVGAVLSALKRDERGEGRASARYSQKWWEKNEGGPSERTHTRTTRGEGEKERSQTNRHSAELLAADANKVERETDDARWERRKGAIAKERERERDQADEWKGREENGSEGSEKREGTRDELRHWIIPEAPGSPRELSI